MAMSGLGSSGLKEDLVGCSYEHDYKILDFIKGGEFHDQQRHCRYVKDS
jgi:hypothetical protein